jgi:VanZ family protein
VEEVIYRFAFLGLLWLALRKPLPNQAAWLAGLLAMLAHNFMHFDDLFLQAPLMALGLGTGMAILWGLPPTILALRRDIESAIAFHWIQDVARFLAGF